MNDPFLETDPRWQPNPMSVETQLLPNLRDFVRENQRAEVEKRPQPQLPDGIRMQRLNGGKWALLVQCGGSGWRMVEGDYDGLLDLAHRISTAP